MTSLRPRRRPGSSRYAVRALAVALAAGSLSALSMPTADAATTTITVGSLDVTALQAAITQANALPASPGDDVRIVFADGLTGDITLPNAGPLMRTTSITPSGSPIQDYLDNNGSFFWVNAQRPVTIDFGGDVGVVSQGDAGYGAFAISSAGVTITNFTNIRAGEGAVTVGAADATISNGAFSDPDTDWLETGVGLTDGASGTVIDNVDFDSVRLFGVYFDDCTTVADTTVTDSTFDNQNPYGDIYVEQGCSAADPTEVTGLQVTDSTFSSNSSVGSVGFDFFSKVSGATFEGNTFDGANIRSFYLGNDSTTEDLVIRDNDFTGTGYAWEEAGRTTHTRTQIIGNRFTDLLAHALVMRQANHIDNTIADNTFTDIRGGSDSTIFLTRQASRTDAGNVIEGNTFEQSAEAEANRWAIYAEMDAPTPGADTGWEIVGNHIDGYGSGGSQAPITIGPNLVRTKVYGNTFGQRTQGTTDATQSEGGGNWFLWNTGSHNSRLQTWRPANAVFRQGRVAFDIAPVDPPVSNNQQPTPPLTLHVYWTADDNAEEYLGAITDVTAAGRVSIPTTHTDGFIRVQTEGGASGYVSQYSGIAQVTAEDPVDPPVVGEVDPVAGTISGTGQPGATVEVSDQDGNVICETTVGEDGTWECTDAIDCDVTSITATQTDTEGNVSTATEPVEVDCSDVDSDGDGLTDAEELELGTDPEVADTDGDGLSDGVEVAGPGLCVDGTNPLVPDSDGDGLTDGQEVTGFTLRQKVRTLAGTRTIGRVSTNPCVKDTDGDGLTDRQEVRGFTIKQRYWVKGKKPRVIGTMVTNPLVKDTDNDTLTDKQEVTGMRTKRYGVRKSNPVDYDTDRGGVGDGREIRAGSDPTRPSSTPKKP
jgi:hypothetical protein